LGQKDVLFGFVEVAADVSMAGAIAGFSFVIWSILCLRVFLGSPGWFARFFLLALASNAAIMMMNTTIMAAKYMGCDRKLDGPFSGFVVGVVLITIIGVAVGVICVHHWLIEDASYAEI
jgi:hypothetical protein